MSRIAKTREQVDDAPWYMVQPSSSRNRNSIANPVARDASGEFLANFKPAENQMHSAAGYDFAAPLIKGLIFIIFYHKQAPRACGKLGAIDVFKMSQR